MNDRIAYKLENLPQKPGVYQFFNDKEKIIYIGKAKSLRSRVRSYFAAKVDSPKTKALVKKIVDLQVIITQNEIEALVLENNLIKKHKPRYNINLKDDKSFPYIRVTNEPFPQIFSTRDIVQDGSRYFGPYTDVKNMKGALRMINKLFKIRSCKYFLGPEVIKEKKVKLCLDYHIKKCDGPCEGLISEEEYNEMVGQVIKLIRGKTDELLNSLQKQMADAAKNLEFEKAAELRDKIEQLNVWSSKMKVVSTDFEDRDIISCAVEGTDAAVSILNIRAGKLLSKKQFRLIAEDESLPKLYAAIVRFYYSEYVEVPKEIIIEVMPDEVDTLRSWLAEKGKRKVHFIEPKRKSDAKSLIEMCRQNAIYLLKEIQLQRMKKEGNLPYVLTSLKRDLRLKNIPRRIECFDISHIQGSDTVASLVVFEEAKPKKNMYRKFIIKTVEGVDDFASMQEVVERRYRRLMEENEPIPELIMVDGGKGQLSSAVETLNEIGLKNYEIIGLAKRLEEVFTPGVSEPVIIPKTSSSLKLLQHIRDEAHRFAITFHRSRRSKRIITTELTSIEGIGEKGAEKLLRNFMSIEEIKKAEFPELTKVIGQAKAKTVYSYYHDNEDSGEKEN